MNLLQTKLRMPPVRREHVPRPRLHRLLRAGLDGRLTLVSAPAGFGKTTLLCEWLQEMDLPVAWLSLDEHDNSWPRFLAYLLASLQMLDPEVGTTLLGALESPQLPPLDTLLSALPAEVGRIHRPFVLVLDDFHVILDPQVHDLLTYVVDNQPSDMHLVLCGRSDPPWPLGRLRATGALTEVRATDLRFTLDEAGTLLNEVLALSLSVQDLSTLEGRTEGWIAGLHLAAMSLKVAPDRHAFVEAFAGSDRFVLDYLMEEVLSGQPPDIRSFLLETSLLDRFNAGLCDRVTGRTDSESMLRRLEAANLFVVPLDNERLWYAYHSLMRSFLRSIQKAQDPQRVADLHLRASEWYEAHGDIVDAIQHAQRAEDHERIGQLLQSNGLALVFQGELSTMLTWLHGYSETWLRAGPWLRVAQLWAHSFSAEASIMLPELTETRELLLEGLRAREDEPASQQADSLRHALAHLTAIEANLAVMDGRHTQAVDLARQALAGLPARDTVTRRYCSVCLGMALRHLGDLQGATEALTLADSPPGELDRAPAPARGLATRAAIQVWMGQLDEAEVTCRRMIALHDDYLRRCGRRLPIAAFGYARLSDIRRERNDLDQALRLARESRLLAEQWQQTDALFESYLQLARALHASGDPQAALALLRRLETLVADRSPWLHAVTRAYEARLCVACAPDSACLDRAQRWAREQPLPAASQLTFRDHPLYLTHAQLMLSDSTTNRDRARSGLELVHRVLRLLEPSGALGLTLQASVLLALFENALGRPAEALATLAGCLGKAEPRGYVRLFLEQGAPMYALLGKLLSADPSFGFAQALRDAFAGQGPAAAPGHESRGRPGTTIMEEPLSDRELDVLRLLVTTLASSEIADHLCVATSTVRSHTKAIYGKLGVHTRLEAIDQARELGLI